MTTWDDFCAVFIGGPVLILLGDFIMTLGTGVSLLTLMLESSDLPAEWLRNFYENTFDYFEEGRIK